MMSEVAVIPKQYNFSHNHLSSEIFFTVSNLPDLELHFPTQVLVAGYYQLSWIEFLVKKTFPQSYISKIIDTKFNNRISLNDNIKITLTWDPEVRQVNFKITDSDQLKTQGKLALQSV